MNPLHPRRRPDPELGAGRTTPYAHSRPLPRFKVVLHHTPGRELMFVAHTVMELTRFGKAEALHRMWEAYHCGKSLVLVTHLERAELFVEQFHGRGVEVSLEPA